MTQLGTNRMHPRERTGVRFVLTNATDPSRAADYSAWYDIYEKAIIRPGLIANAFASGGDLATSVNATEGGGRPDGFSATDAALVRERS